MGLAGCATPPPADDPDAVEDFKEANDPLEPMNRFFFEGTMKMDDLVLHPVAEGYRDTVPPFVRARISDLLANLKSPLIFFNDLLQGNFSRASTTIERMALNTTFGVGGIMDVATPMGLPQHDSDFGETMGVWGIGEGPYLFVPFLGPSNFRDLTGSVAASFSDPLEIYLQDNHMRWVAFTINGVSVVSTRERLLDSTDELKRSSLDFYSALRSAYRQQREAKIRAEIAGGEPPTAFFVRMLPHIQLNF